MGISREPLVIQQPGSKHGEYFNLSGAYLFTVQEFHAMSQTVYHAMTAPRLFYRAFRHLNRGVPAGYQAPPPP